MNTLFAILFIFVVVALGIVVVEKTEKMFGTPIPDDRMEQVHNVYDLSSEPVVVTRYVYALPRQSYPSIIVLA